MDASENPDSRMQKLEFRRWVISYDPEATRRAYEAISFGSPEQCGCTDCRNFAAAREVIYTRGVLSVLDRLGIDQRKEAEIYYGGPIGGGRHVYAGWFHFVGSIESGEDAWSPDGMFRPDSVSDSLEIGFSRAFALVPDAFRQGPLMQLEFQATVPWVLDPSKPE